MKTMYYVVGSLLFLLIVFSSAFQFQIGNRSKTANQFGTIDLTSTSSTGTSNSRQGRGDWTMLTHDNNDSRYSSDSMINSSNVPYLIQRWSIITNFAVTSTPLVLDGAVYFADWGANVYSANLSTGAIKWQVNLGSPISSTLALADDLVFVGVGPYGADEVFALNQMTGATVWKDRLNTTSVRIWASPIAYNGMVLIGTAGSDISNSSEKGELDSLNTSTGKLIWRFVTMIGTTGGAPVWGSVAVDPKLDSIYFGTGNSETDGNSSLYAYSILSVNAANGHLNWFYQAYNSFMSGGELDFGSTPNLFTLSVNGEVHQAVGLGGKDGIYYILDRSSGDLLEKFSITSGAPGSYKGIIGLPGFVYHGYNTDPEIFIPATDYVNSTCCGIVAALIPTNQTFAWKFYTPLHHIFGSVAIVPGAVLFGDQIGFLYALSISNGDVIFKTRLPNEIADGVTVSEGFVLVGQGMSGPGAGLGLFAFSLGTSVLSAQYEFVRELNIKILNYEAAALWPAIFFLIFRNLQTTSARRKDP